MGKKKGKEADGKARKEPAVVICKEETELAEKSEPMMEVT